MKKISLYLLLTAVLLLSSCIEYNSVEFKGIDKVKVDKVSTQNVALTLDVSIYNPNHYNIVIKPSEVDVFVEDKLVGVGVLDQKVRMIKEETKTYKVPLTLELAKGSMMKLMSLAVKSKVELRIKGKVKAGAFGLAKKFDVDRTEMIDLGAIKM